MAWSSDAFGMRQLLICFKFGTISNRSFLRKKTIEQTRERRGEEWIRLWEGRTAQALGLSFGLLLNSSVVGLQQALNLSEAQFPHLQNRIVLWNFGAWDLWFRIPYLPSLRCSLGGWALWKSWTEHWETRVWGCRPEMEQEIWCLHLLDKSVWTVGPQLLHPWQ